MITEKKGIGLEETMMVKIRLLFISWMNGEGGDG